MGKNRFLQMICPQNCLLDKNEFIINDLLGKAIFFKNGFLGKDNFLKLHKKRPISRKVQSLGDIFTKDNLRLTLGRESQEARSKLYPIK